MRKNSGVVVPLPPPEERPPARPVHHPSPPGWARQANRRRPARAQKPLSSGAASVLVPGPPPLTEWLSAGCVLGRKALGRGKRRAPAAQRGRLGHPATEPSTCQCRKGRGRRCRPFGCSRLASYLPLGGLPGQTASAEGRAAHQGGRLLPPGCGSAHACVPSQLTRAGLARGSGMAALGWEARQALGESGDPSARTEERRAVAGCARRARAGSGVSPLPPRVMSTREAALGAPSPRPEPRLSSRTRSASLGGEQDIHSLPFAGNCSDARVPAVAAGAFPAAGTGQQQGMQIYT